MELKIHLVCSECHQSKAVDLFDFAPGRPRRCGSCQAPARLTPASLKQFSRDLRRYCQE